MMAYAWIIKDLTSLTKAESVLLYGTGSIVIVGWVALSVKRKS